MVVSRPTMYIFIIDDDPEDCELFYEAVKEVNSGFRCAHASDGKEAMLLLENDPDTLPDFIFLDINMPVMGGRECLTLIKQNPNLRNIPVIMYSTTSNPNEIKAFYSLGAHDFLVKPANFAKLVHALQSIIRGNGSSKNK